MLLFQENKENGNETSSTISSSLTPDSQAPLIRTQKEKYYFQNFSLVSLSSLKVNQGISN